MRGTLEALPVPRPVPTAAPPPGLCLDKGYDDDEVRDLGQAVGVTAHLRARGEAAQALKRDASCNARRGVVERTQSGLKRFRRLVIRWEKRADTYLAMLHLACGIITWRATGLLG